jgi:hypothetical protein
MTLVRKLALVVLAASFVMQGCTTASKNIPVKYVAPNKYQSYNCYQLSIEYQRVQNRMLELGGQLDEQSSKDGLMGVFGAIVFFPALFVIGGHSEKETEYAALKGDVEAMRQAAFQKKCPGIATKSPSAGLR